MGRETLDAGEGVDRSDGPGQRTPVELDHARAPLELVGCGGERWTSAAGARERPMKPASSTTVIT